MASYYYASGTKDGRDAAKDIAGIFFQNLVEANGSEDCKRLVW